MLCTDDHFPDQSGWLPPFGSFTDRTGGQALKDNPKERRGQWFAGPGDRWEMFWKQNSSEYAEYEMLFTIIDFENDFIVFKDHFLVVFLSNCFLWTGHEGRRHEVCYNMPRCVVDLVIWVCVKLAVAAHSQWIFQWPIMTGESEP